MFIARSVSLSVRLCGVSALALSLACVSLLRAAAYRQRGVKRPAPLVSRAHHTLLTGSRAFASLSNLCVHECMCVCVRTHARAHAQHPARVQHVCPSHNLSVRTLTYTT